MLVGFGYLYKFVMFYFLFFFKKQEIIDYEEPVGQNSMVFFLFLLKIGLVGRTDRTYSDRVILKT